jgi:hypothetical protein
MNLNTICLPWEARPKLRKKMESEEIRAWPMVGVLDKSILLGRKLRPENVHMLQGSKSIVAKSF